MKKNLFFNFLYQASYQLLLIVLPIITVPIVSKALGAEGVGIYNYVNSIVTYFVTFSALGIVNYGIREISMVRNDREALSRKFWEIETLSIYISILIILVYIVFSIYTGETIYFLVSGLTLIGALFDITWFFQGVENFKKITIRNFIIRLVSFVSIVLFINDSSDLLLYIFINAASNLISQASLWLSIPSLVDFVKVPISKSFSHLKPSLTFFISKLSMTAYQDATKTILGIMTNMAIVGLYSNAYVIVMMIANIINAMNIVLIPRMSNLYGQKDETKMIYILQKAIHLQLFFSIAITFGILVISNKLVGWFFGAEFSEIKIILPMLAPIVITQSFQMAVASQYLIPRNQMKSYNLSVMLGALITVIVTVLTVPYMSVYGAVLGINLGYLTVAILRLVLLYKQTTFRLEYSNLIKWITSAVIMYIAIRVGTDNFESTLITTIIQIVIGTGIYFIVTALLKANPISPLVSQQFKTIKESKFKK